MPTGTGPQRRQGDASGWSVALFGGGALLLLLLLLTRPLVRHHRRVYVRGAKHGKYLRAVPRENDASFDKKCSSGTGGGADGRTSRAL
jgi:hypothetical protein